VRCEKGRNEDGAMQTACNRPARNGSRGDSRTVGTTELSYVIAKPRYLN
jgi:hypothetical protein